MTSHRPRRVPARLSLRTGVAAALAAGLLLTGCSATNPIETSKDYDASDGVGVTIGELRALNLLVLTEGAGEPGVLHGAVVNDGAEDVTLTITIGGAGVTEGADAATVEVPAGETVLLTDAEGADTALVAVAATPAAPGDLVEVALTSDVAGSASLRVPVLDGTLPGYATSLPTAAPTDGASTED